MSNPEGSEVLVFSTSNKEQALQMRNMLISSFVRLWVYVYNVNQIKWEVKVANNWGGRVSKEVLAAIELAVKEFKNVKKAPRLTTKE